MTLLTRASVNPYWYFVETMSVCHTIYEIFSVKECRNLETGGRGRSRSLKMAPFDRSYTTFYWSAIVSIAVCCTIFKLSFECPRKLPTVESHWGQNDPVNLMRYLLRILL